MRCCGGESPLDWSTSSWSNQSNHHHHHRHHQEFIVPDSCCFQRASTTSHSASFIGIPQMAPLCRNEHRAPAHTVNKFTVCLYTRWPQKWHMIVRALNGSYFHRFSELFHCQNREKICSNTIAKDPTIPQVCRYTTLWNISFKSNNWKRDDFCNNGFKRN